MWRPNIIGRELGVGLARAANGLRHLTGEHVGALQPTPRELVWSRDKVRLYRYRGQAGVGRIPVLLVMSLVTRSYVFDLREGSSLVADLLDAGFDVYLLDWGVPDAVEAANTLETYCDGYLPHVVAAVLADSGARRLAMLGYCLGAVLSLLSLAGHPQFPVAGLVALAAPIDFGKLGPAAEMLRAGRLEPDDMLDETGNVPAAAMLRAMRIGRPTGDVGTYLNLWQSLHSIELLAAHQALIGWSQDHIPFPGAAFGQVVELSVRQGLLATGTVPLGGRDVSLSRIELPVLNVVGERDDLVPPGSTEPLPRLLEHARVTSLRLPAGHVGLFVGRQARRACVPGIVNWITELEAA